MWLAAAVALTGGSPARTATPAPADEPFPAGPEATPGLNVVLTLDPPVAAPAGRLTAAAVSAITSVLKAQAEALRAADPERYLATFESPAPAGLPVAGRPAARVMAETFGAVPPGSRVEFAAVTPEFFSPGPGRTAEVLARHLVAYKTPGGEARLLDVTALERLGETDSGRWRVFDWFLADEREARPAWLTWVRGAVTLEPFVDGGQLEAEMTYTLFPGFGDQGRNLSFDLAETFEVTRVSSEGRDLSFERNGKTLAVRLGSRLPASGPTVVAIAYRGKIAPTPDDGEGNLETLGPHGIYLRPETGWYPQPDGCGFLRGAVTITLPGWWSAVASGRLVAQSPPGDLRSYTWALDTPARIYLAAGPYNVASAVTPRGVTVRAFFYAREAAWSATYLAEAERVLDFLSDKIAPYPYPDLTLVEVKRFYFSGLSARSLVLLDEGWLTGPKMSPDSRDLLAHEISHQWWGEMVPVLDDPDWFLWEGLATYSEALYAESLDGQAELAREMAGKAAIYAEAARSHGGWSIAEANVRTEEWQQHFVYEKAAWVFHMLRTLLGDDAFFGFLRSYLDRFAGRQPGTKDFSDMVAAQVPGDPYLASFVERWVQGTDSIDLTLSAISVRRTGGGQTRLDFTLSDRGTGDFPRAEVAVTLRGGGSETFVLAPGRESVLVPGEVTAIEADPNDKVLDLDRANNRFVIVLGVALPETPAKRLGLALAAGFAVAAVLAVRRRRRVGHLGLD